MHSIYTMLNYYFTCGFPYFSFPAFSIPAFSTLSGFVPHFPVLHFLVSHFQRPRYDPQLVKRSSENVLYRVQLYRTRPTSNSGTRYLQCYKHYAKLNAAKKSVGINSHGSAGNSHCPSSSSSSVLLIVHSLLICRFSTDRYETFHTY